MNFRFNKIRFRLPPLRQKRTIRTPKKIDVRIVFIFDLSAQIGLDSADKKRTARASAAFYCIILPYVRRVHKKSADIRKGFKIITYRTIINSAQALQRRTPCRAALRFVFYFVA